MFKATKLAENDAVTACRRSGEEAAAEKIFLDFWRFGFRRNKFQIANCRN